MTYVALPSRSRRGLACPHHRKGRRACFRPHSVPKGLLPLKVAPNKVKRSIFVFCFFLKKRRETCTSF